MDSRDKTCAQRPTGVHRWVVNDKSPPHRTMCTGECAYTGTQLYTSPHQTPLIDTVVAMEEEARQLADEDSEDLWG